MKLTNPKNGEVFASRYTTHLAAHAALLARIEAGEFRDPKFAQNIYSATVQVKGQQLGTPGQLYWLHKLANNGPGERDRADAPTAKLNMKGLLDILTHAKGSGLKNPSIVLTTKKGIEVKVSLAGPKSRYQGAIMVSSVAFRGPYYGRIMPDGGFYPGRDFIPEVGELLEDMSKNPKGAAAHQGHLTGRCCFCRKTLDDPKSTALGYGPVCAKNFGLLHSVKQAKKMARFEAGTLFDEDDVKTSKVAKRPVQQDDDDEPGPNMSKRERNKLKRRLAKQGKVDDEKPKATKSAVRRIVRRIIDKA